MSTRVIAVADMNQDGWVDIIVGNGVNDSNQLFLNNGGGTFYEVSPSPFPEGRYSTEAIAVADISGDGKFDVLVGNDFGQQNQFQIAF